MLPPELDQEDTGTFAKTRNRNSPMMTRPRSKTQAMRGAGQTE